MNEVKYKARPIEVEAFRFTGPDSIPESFLKYVSCNGQYAMLYAYTHHGTLYAKPGTWVVRYGDNVRVMLNEAFRKAYEAVGERENVRNRG